MMERDERRNPKGLKVKSGGLIIFFAMASFLSVQEAYCGPGSSQPGSQAREGAISEQEPG
jgi:hypothetical protein